MADVILTPNEARRLRKAHSDELYYALTGLVAEFEKFSRYGSPMAHAANERMTYAKRALAKADGQVSA